jgi:type II secretory pathway pseudopilin PulG
MKIFGLIHKKEGQTLIEAVIALAVAMLVISALAVLTANSVNNAKYAENKSLANNLLNKTLNEVRVVRDQQTWDTGSTPFANYPLDQCYKINLTTWQLITPGHTCSSPFSDSSCGTGATRTTNCVSSNYDCVDSPSSITSTDHDYFFCRRLELKLGPETDSRTVDVSIAWTDGSGDHVVNAVTDLTKHAL